MKIMHKNIYSPLLGLALVISSSGCVVDEKKKDFTPISKSAAVTPEPRFNIVIKNYCVAKNIKRVGFNVVNRNYHLTYKGVVADIDSDGISDADESTEVAALFGISPEKYDTNGDKYSDAIIYNGMITFQKQGELPLCSLGDLDADGLPDCAENVLGTDPQHSDSDRDGISDELEVFIGLNPIIKDSHLDSDMDGVSNYDELVARTPLYESNHLGAINFYKINYNLIAESSDNIQDCYTYKANNITYQVKRPTNNMLELYFIEDIAGSIKHLKYSRLIQWSDYQLLHAEISKNGGKNELPTFTIEYADLLKKD